MCSQGRLPLRGGDLLVGSPGTKGPARTIRPKRPEKAILSDKGNRIQARSHTIAKGSHLQGRTRGTVHREKAIKATESEGGNRIEEKTQDGRSERDGDSRVHRTKSDQKN